LALDRFGLGRTAAELLFGESFTADIAPGSHRLRANNTLVWKTVDCDLQPGEHARYQVINRPGFGSFAMLSLLGVGPIYLAFDREPAPVDPSSPTPRG